MRLRSPVRFDASSAPLTLDGLPYRGSLVIGRSGSGLYVVNDVPLESYLRGVVPREMPGELASEALRAQAVAARSYALATMKPHSSFDLYADTRSQVYGGIRAEHEATDRAVASTAGEVLSWQGGVATTYFSSTSGGRTAAIGDAWAGSNARPYLVSVADPFDARSPHHR